VMNITYRDLTTLDEFAAVVQLERDIWGPAYDDVVPVPILAVSVHSGGILIGAFDERPETRSGLVYSLPGIKDGKPTQWSHMAGVVRDYQSRGIGMQLKLLQRERALNAVSTRAVDLRSAAGDERPSQLCQARRPGPGVRG